MHIIFYNCHKQEDKTSLVVREMSKKKKKLFISCLSIANTGNPTFQPKNATNVEFDKRKSSTIILRFQTLGRTTLIALMIL